MNSSNTNLIKEIACFHYKAYASEPAVISFAPGRVEVLGNHTDYNEGFVISSAIEQGVAVALSNTEKQSVSIYAPDIREEVLEVKLPIKEPLHSSNNFANYVLGVIYYLEQNGVMISPLNITIKGNLPLGAGLSSSAALECATAIAILRIVKQEMELLEIAKICQKAEHTFVGAKCGLLDQLSSLHGRKNKLLFIDFRTLAVETLPFSSEVSLIMMNSKIKHSLVDSEYNSRRASCEKAVEIFSKEKPLKALRDISLEEFEKMGHLLPQEVRKRARHIVEENDRVLKARRMLEESNFRGFGELMFASHISSQRNFENSAPELDFLVEQARKVNDVLGARLSGGGFGGAIIILARTDAVPTVLSSLGEAYEHKYGRSAEIHIVSPADGARIVESIV